MYTSELAWHQNRVVFLRYNLNLRSIFGVVNTPVHHHAKPSNNVYSPLTYKRVKSFIGFLILPVLNLITKSLIVFDFPPIVLFNMNCLGQLPISMLSISFMISWFSLNRTNILVVSNGLKASIGKVSFTAPQIAENAKEFISTIIKLKPTASKGVYIKSIYLSSTMSKGIKIDPKSAE